MEPILRFFWCVTECEMKYRGLVVFVGDLLEDSSAILLDLCLWELCFSLVSPLWESCYFLALR